MDGGVREEELGSWQGQGQLAGAGAVGRGRGSWQGQLAVGRG